MEELFRIALPIIATMLLLIGILPGEADWEYWTRKINGWRMRSLKEVPMRFRKTRWYIKRRKEQSE